MDANLNSLEIKNEIAKALGLKARDLSIRKDSSSICLTLKRWADIDVASRMLRKYENVRRDEVTGEILGGGNVYVSVNFDHNLVLTEEMVETCQKILGRCGESMTGRSLDFWFRKAFRDEFKGFKIGESTAQYICGRFASRPENRARFY
jgi:hypothetical protein